MMEDSVDQRYVSSSGDEVLAVKADDSMAHVLAARQNNILHAIDVLEKRVYSNFQWSKVPNECIPAETESPLQEADKYQENKISQEKNSVVSRLTSLLDGGGAKHFKFVRVPSNYYEQSFETRRDLLGAASVKHLCKSIVMVNTQASEEVVDCSNPRNSKYYVVVTQYAAKFNAEKLRNFIYALNEGRIPKKRFNMRLAPEDVSNNLTGYQHNAVTPIGMNTEIPVILSEAITKLEPDFFWLGGGEVDLKLGIKTSEFVQLVNPFIVDC